MKLVIEVYDLVWQPNKGPSKISSTHNFDTLSITDTGEKIELANANNDQLERVGNFFANQMIDVAEKQFSNKVISFKINVKLGDKPALPN